jgi:uncharacterized membrane protein
VERTDLGRVGSFTDGVMAVAITLLVLNLEVPRVAPSELDEALVDLFPSLIAYVLSFALVGRFWAVHHRVFETLRAFDTVLMALNLAFLAFIVLVPFATEVFDRYTDEPVAAAVFGATMGLAALTNWAMISYTLHRGYVHESHRPAAQPFASRIALGMSAMFLISVPVAYLDTTVATLMWIATMALRFPLVKLGSRGW